MAAGQLPVLATGRRRVLRPARETTKSVHISSSRASGASSTGRATRGRRHRHRPTSSRRPGSASAAVARRIVGLLDTAAPARLMESIGRPIAQT